MRNSRSVFEPTGPYAKATYSAASTIHRCVSSSSVPSTSRNRWCRWRAWPDMTLRLCDPRDSFASAERFPGELFLEGWPDEALDAHGVDARTAVVTLSHDPKIDTPALRVALSTEAFYIGALGSSRTHAKRVAALSEAGVSGDAIARIDGPVGLDIGASSPAEIAVSIMAEMTERLRHPEARPGAGS